MPTLLVLRSGRVVASMTGGEDGKTTVDHLRGLIQGVIAEGADSKA
jgi:hypothetical protein